MLSIGAAKSPESLRVVRLVLNLWISMHPSVRPVRASCHESTPSSVRMRLYVLQIQAIDGIRMPKYYPAGRTWVDLVQGRNEPL